jgi:hypothetical protein
MSTRHQRESQPENRRWAADLHDAAPHAHIVGEQHGKQDHLTGSELSRLASEPSHEAYRNPQAAAAGHGLATFGHNEIAALAYDLWQARGCPGGSPEEDWFHAAEQLRSRAQTR